jgi:hypothetical protein
MRHLVTKTVTSCPNCLFITGERLHRTLDTVVVYPHISAAPIRCDHVHSVSLMA